MSDDTWEGSPLPASLIVSLKPPCSRVQLLVGIKSQLHPRPNQQVLAGLAGSVKEALLHSLWPLPIHSSQKWPCLRVQFLPCSHSPAVSPHRVVGSVVSAAQHFAIPISSTARNTAFHSTASLLLIQQPPGIQTTICSSHPRVRSLPLKWRVPHSTTWRKS